MPPTNLSACLGDIHPTASALSKWVTKTNERFQSFYEALPSVQFCTGTRSAQRVGQNLGECEIMRLSTPLTCTLISVI